MLTRYYKKQDSLTQNSENTCHLLAYNFARDHHIVKINYDDGV